MKTLIHKQGSRKIERTGYKPQFAYKSLCNILRGQFECFESGKSKNTNSYYIECGTNDYSVDVQIRISDHTKMTESHIFELKNEDSILHLDIVSTEDFAKAKQLINKFIK